MASVLLLPALTARGDTAVSQWTGANSATWNSSGNWVSGVPSEVTTGGTGALFNSTFTNQPTLTGGAGAAGIWVAEGVGQNVTIGATAPESLNLGGTSTLNSNVATGLLVDDSGNFGLNISPNVTLVMQQGATSFLVNNAGTLNVQGTINMNAKNLTLGGTNAAGNIVISGLLYSTSIGNLTLNGAGTVTLSGNNVSSSGTYSGVTTLTSGILAVGNNNALGTGALSLNGGTLEALSSGITIGNTVNALASSTLGGANALTLTGNFTNSGGNRTITVNNTALTSFLGNIYLSESQSTDRLLDFTGAGNLALSGQIADSAAGVTSGSVTGAGLSFDSNYTATATISGNDTYTKNTTIANGTINLTGSLGNTAVTVSGGTLSLQASAALSQNTVTVSGGTLTETVPGALGGSANLAVTSGTANLSQANPFSGTATTSGAGMLQLGNANSVQNSTVTVNASNSVAFASGIGGFNFGALSGSSGLVLTDGASSPVALSAGSNNATTTYSGTLSGAGSLTKSGTGTLTLSGPNTFSGGMTVSQGTLGLGASSVASGGVVTSGATGTGNVSLANGVSLTSSFGVSWYVPQITLSGTVNLISVNRLTTSFGSLQLSSQTDTLNVNGKSLAVSGNTLTGNAEGTGLSQWEVTSTLSPIIQNGVLDLESTAFGGASNGTYGAFRFSNSVSFANSSLIVGSNVLLLDNIGTASAAPDTTLNGIYDMTDTSNTYVKSLTGTGAVYLSMVSTAAAAGTLNITATAGSTTFAGSLNNGPAIGAALSVVKTGSSTQILSGVSTYTGATAVKAGSLIVSGSLSGSSLVTVGNASSLSTVATLGGTGSVGNVVIGAAANNVGATLAPGAPGSIGALSTANLTFFDGKANLAIHLGQTTAGNPVPGTNNSAVITSGSVTLNGANLQLTLDPGFALSGDNLYYIVINNSGQSGGAANLGELSYGGSLLGQDGTFTASGQQFEISYTANYGTGTFDGTGNSIALEAVPEPGSCELVLGACALLVALRRRRAATP